MAAPLVPVPDERWLSALPAADFAAFEADLLPSTLAALDAARLLVTFDDWLWLSALPAAFFAALDALPDRSVLPAADAAFLPVRSLLATLPPWTNEVLTVGEREPGMVASEASLGRLYRPQQARFGATGVLEMAIVPR